MLSKRDPSTEHVGDDVAAAAVESTTSLATTTIEAATTSQVATVQSVLDPVGDAMQQEQNEQNVLQQQQQQTDKNVVVLFQTICRAVRHPTNAIPQIVTALQCLRKCASPSVIQPLLQGCIHMHDLLRIVNDENSPSSVTKLQKIDFLRGLLLSPSIYNTPWITICTVVKPATTTNSSTILQSLLPHILIDMQNFLHQTIQNYTTKMLQQDQQHGKQRKRKKVLVIARKGETLCSTLPYEYILQFVRNVMRLATAPSSSFVVFKSMESLLHTIVSLCYDLYSHTTITSEPEKQSSSNTLRTPYSLLTSILDIVVIRDRHTGTSVTSINTTSITTDYNIAAWFCLVLEIHTIYLRAADLIVLQSVLQPYVVSSSIQPQPSGDTTTTLSNADYKVMMCKCLRAVASLFKVSSSSWNKHDTTSSPQKTAPTTEDVDTTSKETCFCHLFLQLLQSLVGKIIVSKQQHQQCTAFQQIEEDIQSHLLSLPSHGLRKWILFLLKQQAKRVDKIIASTNDDEGTQQYQQSNGSIANFRRHSLTKEGPPSSFASSKEEDDAYRATTICVMLLNILHVTGMFCRNKDKAAITVGSDEISTMVSRLVSQAFSTTSSKATSTPQRTKRSTRQCGGISTPPPTISNSSIATSSSSITDMCWIVIMTLVAPPLVRKKNKDYDRSMEVPWNLTTFITAVKSLRYNSMGQFTTTTTPSSLLQQRNSSLASMMSRLGVVVCQLGLLCNNRPSFATSSSKNEISNSTTPPQTPRKNVNYIQILMYLALDRLLQFTTTDILKEWNDDQSSTAAAVFAVLITLFYEYTSHHADLFYGIYVSCQSVLLESNRGHALVSLYATYMYCTVSSSRWSSHIANDISTSSSLSIHEHVRSTDVYNALRKLLSLSMSLQSFQELSVSLLSLQSCRTELLQVVQRSLPLVNTYDVTTVTQHHILHRRCNNTTATPHSDERYGLVALMSLLRSNSNVDDSTSTTITDESMMERKKAWRIVSDLIVLNRPRTRRTNRTWLYQELSKLLPYFEDITLLKRLWQVCIVRLSRFVWIHNNEGDDDRNNSHRFPSNAGIVCCQRWPQSVVKPRQQNIHREEEEDLVGLFALGFSLQAAVNDNIDHHDNAASVMLRTLLCDTFHAPRHQSGCSTSSDDLDVVLCSIFSLAITEKQCTSKWIDHISQVLKNIKRDELSNWVDFQEQPFWISDADFPCHDTKESSSSITNVKVMLFNMAIEKLLFAVLDETCEDFSTNESSRKHLARHVCHLFASRKKLSHNDGVGTGEISTTFTNLRQVCEGFCVIVLPCLCGSIIEQESPEDCSLFLEATLDLLVIMQKSSLDSKRLVFQYAHEIYMAISSEVGAVQVVTYLEKLRKNHVQSFSRSVILTHENIDDLMQTIRQQCLDTLSCSCWALCADNGVLLSQQPASDSRSAKDILSIATHFVNDLVIGLQGASGGITNGIFHRFAECISNIIIVVRSQLSVVVPSNELNIIEADCRYIEEKLYIVLCQHSFVQAKSFREALKIIMSTIPDLVCAVEQIRFRRNCVPKKHDDITDSKKMIICTHVLVILGKIASNSDPDAQWCDIVGIEHVSQCSDEIEESNVRNKDAVITSLRKQSYAEPDIHILFQSHQTLNWCLCELFLSFDNIWIFSKELVSCSDSVTLLHGNTANYVARRMRTFHHTISYVRSLIELRTKHETKIGKDQIWVSCFLSLAAKGKFLLLLDRIVTVFQSHSVVLNKALTNNSGTFESHDLRFTEALACILIFIESDFDFLTSLHHWRLNEGGNLLSDFQRKLATENQVVRRLSKLLMRFEELQKVLKTLQELFFDDDNKLIKKMLSSAGLSQDKIRTSLITKIKAVRESSSAINRKSKQKKQVDSNVTRQVKKLRRHYKVRSRNSVVDDLLRVDEVMEGEARNHDAFADLDDFLVEG